ncbi:hypothetical protein AALP_AA7G164900 [Arabis alpina]|uniref:Cytochrome p450 n=1 Tax=Arabis alpina TaxID=50452 RepID=A0A087GIH9_ARAAL|nr:hypothetical protein AALP_AA7G164900 [Arabis alpina]
MAALFTVDFQNCFIFILVCLFSILFYSLLFKKSKAGFNLPPSPPSLPIIGHLHLLLSFLIHKSLQKLSSKYGPFLHLRVFNVPIVLVSSASIAYEIFTAHDVNVSTRNLPTNEGSLFFGSLGFTTAPYEDYWKFMKKLIVTKLLGPQALERSGGIRAEEVERFYSNLLDKAMRKDLFRGERPLKKFGISPFKKELASLSTRFDEVLEKILVEYEDNIDEHHQGTDTSTHAIQWKMAEIINNPNILERLREEIDFVVGKSRLIQETDVPNIPFLQAVVKEGLRLHPPVPILVRMFQESCEIKDFYIAEKTTLLVNLYDMMRDPDTWEDPEEFKPERFLASSRSEQEDKIRAEVLKYIPFGSGRRACPGSNLAYESIAIAIGVMVQCFDWKFKGDKVNMEEARGAMTLTMAHPFKCTLVPRTILPFTSS